MKKIFCSLFCVILSVVLSYGYKGESIEFADRSMSIDKECVELDSVLEEYDSYSKEYSNNSLNIVFTDILNIEQDNSIVNFSDAEITDEELEALNNSIITYEFSYNVDTNIITVCATMDNNGKIDVDTIQAKAFYNSNGDVDAMFLVEGETVFLSEFQNSEVVNHGWLSRLAKKVVKAVVVAVVSVVCPPLVVCACALYAAYNITEDLLAVRNYNHNKKLPQPEPYIHDQDDYSSWKFGASTMDINGCGVIATYNALKLEGEEADLLSIVFDFDYRSGTLALGLFGADPTHVKEYLSLKGVSTQTCFSFNSLNNNLDDGETAIICKWNDKNNITKAAHYYVVKRSNGGYYTYNRGGASTSIAPKSNFSDVYDDNDGMIVSYII